MGRAVWLASTLRGAGLRVVEVDGWETRGSSTFEPVGVQWHATAGSRTRSAQGEVDTILDGSETAPPPIAQLMIFRDGVVYVCAAGRCNHNKVGWAGPNKGLGNTDLFGIEMANDNRGEPWPDVQLDAARRATVAIFRKLGTDPRHRLSGHYEHQPYVGRPPGERSTKSDPRGVNMSAERSRVYNLAKGEDVSKSDVLAALDEMLTSKSDVNIKRRQALVSALFQTDDVIPAPGKPLEGNTHWWLQSYVYETYERVSEVATALNSLISTNGVNHSTVVGTVLDVRNAILSAVDNVGANLSVSDEQVRLIGESLAPIVTNAMGELILRLANAGKALQGE